MFAQTKRTVCVPVRHHPVRITDQLDGLNAHRRSNVWDWMPGWDAASSNCTGPRADSRCNVCTLGSIEIQIFWPVEQSHGTHVDEPLHMCTCMTLKLTG